MTGEKPPVAGLWEKFVAGLRLAGLPEEKTLAWLIWPADGELAAG